MPSTSSVSATLVWNSVHDIPSILLYYHISRAAIFHLFNSRTFHVSAAYSNIGNISDRISMILAAVVRFWMSQISLSLPIATFLKAVYFIYMNKMFYAYYSYLSTLNYNIFFQIFQVRERNSSCAILHHWSHSLPMVMYQGLYPH